MNIIKNNENNKINKNSNGMNINKYLLISINIFLFFFFTFSFASADITTGLVGHWSFDETSGTTAQDSSIMNSQWNTNNPQSDLNNDGIVNSIDFSIMNGEWNL